MTAPAPPDGPNSTDETLVRDRGGEYFALKRVFGQCASAAYDVNAQHDVAPSNTVFKLENLQRWLNHAAMHALRRHMARLI